MKSTLSIPVFIQFHWLLFDKQGVVKGQICSLLIWHSSFMNMHQMVLKLLMNFQMTSLYFVLYLFPLCLLIVYSNLLCMVTSCGLIGQSIISGRMVGNFLCYYIQNTSRSQLDLVCNVCMQHKSYLCHIKLWEGVGLYIHWGPLIKCVVVSILLLINQHCGCFSFFVPVYMLQKCKVPLLVSLLL